KSALSVSLEDGNLAFMGFPVLCGSHETVAQKIDAIVEDTGIDGMLFSWADFVGGLTDFGENIMPRLKCLN
ncbi:MAG: pyrimidine monooxygenase RutA, partial [Pseudomonadota bacterium]